mgnify:CR=1 FL=1
MSTTTITRTRRDALATVFAYAVAGLALVALHPYSARAEAGQAHLRIMETTDLHVHVWPYDYYADKPVDTLGLARTAALVAVGAFVGFGSALTGTGGPVLLVPVLLTLGVAPLRAVAVSQAVH